MVPMNGAESLVRTLVACGVEVSFTNPGTSEMHFVAALDKVEGMRCVLGLFEGVVTGAADGYGRMLGKPASTLLHLGPGLANGLANLHNASRAQVPIVNIIGDHATYHKRHDAPLTADIEALARPYSKWLRSSATAKDVAGDGAEAVAQSRRSPGQITTLILPADTAWGEASEVASLPDIPAAPVPADATIERAATMLKNGLPTGFVLGGKALHGRGLIAAGRIAAGTGARLMTTVGFARIERGAGRPLVERIPYVIDQSLDYLKQFAPADPGGCTRSCCLLRLSRQAERADPARHGDPHAGPARRGLRGGAGGAGCRTLPACGTTGDPAAREGFGAKRPDLAARPGPGHRGADPRKRHRDR